MNRATLREGMDVSQHLKLLDADVDEILSAIDKGRVECRDGIEKLQLHVDGRLDRQDRRIGAILTTAVGCLVTLVGGLILLVVTVATR